MSPTRSDEERAAFYSGQYSGWARPPGGEWEDLIGVVKIDCAANHDMLVFTIVTLEFGTWTGQMSREGPIVTGSTGQHDTNFRLEFDDEKRAGFYGGIYSGAGELLLQLRFHAT